MPGEWHNERLENIVTALCEPFGISVSAEVDTGEPFMRFRIEEGESVFEAIDRACRFRAVLPLSDGRGGLVLGGPSRSRTSVRVERGMNIISASGTSSWLSRFSAYTLLGQQAGGLDGFTADQVAHVKARGARQRRQPPPAAHHHRRAVAGRARGPMARIQWEANVRSARSRSARVTVQGWREAPDGDLWAPGRLVYVADDWLGIDQDMLISATSQSLERGRDTDDARPRAARGVRAARGADGRRPGGELVELSRFQILSRELRRRVMLMIGRAVLTVVERRDPIADRPGGGPDRRDH